MDLWIYFSNETRNFKTSFVFYNEVRQVEIINMQRSSIDEFLQCTSLYKHVRRFYTFQNEFDSIEELSD
jgi:hypothetical protein